MNDRHPWPGRRTSRSLRARTVWFHAGWLLLGLTLSRGAERLAAPAQPPPADLPGLCAQLEAHVGQSRFRHARWGIQIVSLDSGQTVFAHEADRLFIPASNTKLYTGALALDRLGPDFRIRTFLECATPVDRQGVLRGDLILRGQGDPTFAARYHEGSLDRALAPLVTAAAAAGLKQVRGDLVVDAAYFTGAPLGAGWEWDDLQYGYGAEVSALTINDNGLDVRVRPAGVPGRLATIQLEPATDFVVVSNACVTAPPGVPREVQVLRPVNRNLIVVSGQIPLDDAGLVETVSVHEPAAWFGRLLKERLEGRGIRVTGRVRTIEDAPGVGSVWASARRIELGFVESPPLQDLLARMLKPSQNLHAQLLLFQVGAAEGARAAANPAGPQTASPAGAAATTEAAGVKALNAFLRAAGIPAEEVQLEEGSGLARRNLVTPAATVRLLRHMDRHPAAGVFRAALPVAGVDGTLRNRMRNTPAAGNARAKTGTLNGVFTLSGYVSSMAGERFVFSLMLNNFKNPDPDRPARADLDEIVVTLASLPWRASDAGRSAR